MPVGFQNSVTAGTVALAGRGWLETGPVSAPRTTSVFARFRFPREVISVAVRWYLRYGLSYRDVEELLAERGVTVDYVTVYRWVQRFTPEFIEAARPCRHAPGNRWFADETYLKVAGKWTYLYRAIDQHGQVIDVLLSARRSVAFCPPSRKWIISPAHPHFRWRGCQVLRHGYGTTSAAVCRGMPFCPCYFRVDLRPRTRFVLLLCWRESPGQPGISALQPTRAKDLRRAPGGPGMRPAARDAPVPAGWRLPAATRRTGGPVGAGPRERFRSTTVRTRRGPPSPQRPGPAAQRR